LFGGYGLALAALALVVFGAYDSYPRITTTFRRPKRKKGLFSEFWIWGSTSNEKCTLEIKENRPWPNISDRPFKMKAKRE